MDAGTVDTPLGPDNTEGTTKSFTDPGSNGLVTAGLAFALQRVVALAAEGIFAFFLESGFLAVLLFGWDRVDPGSALLASHLPHGAGGRVAYSGAHDATAFQVAASILPSD